MTTTFGLTPQGLVVMALTDIRDDLNQRLWQRIATTLDLSDGSLEGQIAGIVAEAISKCWNLLQALDSSLDPDKAVDALLDAICILTGTTRRDASTSEVTIQVTGDPTTLVSAGFQARVPPNGTPFVSAIDQTLVAAPSWAATTSYSVGNRVEHGSRVYHCVDAGDSASSGGPVGVDPIAVEVDGTVSWRFLGNGTAAIDVVVDATVTGATVANAGTLTEIVTPVGGVNGVNNLLDAAVGKPLMNNAELRVLRELELAQPGTGPADAIRAALLQVGANTSNPVTAATVFMNVDDITSTDGIPPHSVECLVRGGDDQAIRDCLRTNVAGGIRTWGTTVGTSTDSQGTAQTMRFTRPTLIPIYARISVDVDAESYPLDGDQQIKDDVALWGQGQPTGKDAVASAIGARSFDIAGVEDVTESLVYTDAIGAATAWAATTAYSATTSIASVVSNDGGRKYICTAAGTSAGSGGPTGIGTDITDGTVHWRFLGATIPVSLRQLATYDSTRIVVVNTPTVP
jgi:hypothetical protein